MIENHRREWVKYLIYKGRHRRKSTHSAGRYYIKNRNIILRQFLPKKTNFDLFSQHQIDIIRNKINNRPMKVLNWNT
ncbi:MAG: hypothetical protein IJ738_02250, partial [Alphaproteobacteria bacterium]|nr:hypothetical protein [Alphaproteobacteria bacterium]